MLAKTSRAGVMGVGVRRVLVVPSPSWPNAFHPQQYASPAVLRPQLCRPPAESFAKAIPVPTGAGVVWAVLVESPSCAQLLLPQQYAVPWTLRPQVCQYPPLRLVKRMSPATAAGELR